MEMVKRGAKKSKKKIDSKIFDDLLLEYEPVAAAATGEDVKMQSVGGISEQKMPELAQDSENGKTEEQKKKKKPSEKKEAKTEKKKKSTEKMETDASTAAKGCKKITDYFAKH